MSDSPALSDQAPRPAFAHASEAEFARILDFYGVRWEYEPDTFPIGWNLDGDVVESFSPDFHLPELDLYVELTTLKQSLVRKKNRKLRRLRELYPDVRIKLFYARDFRMLLLRFGRIGLARELSGATGQATPPRHGVLTPTRVAEAADGTPTVGAEPDLLTALPLGDTPANGRRGRRRGRRRRPAGRAVVLSPLPASPAGGAGRAGDPVVVPGTLSA